VCRLVTSVRLELRLTAGAELRQSQVVRSHEDLVEVCMSWRDAMIAKGDTTPLARLIA